ncbi:hypothetical protein L596_001067 [Steinernema carpocapsae]|uniref:Uncharacterized protein n=1 Tax=Steinernema carpocapsae TaxID=34508 RepID=A0A4U8UP64_STECR|nr:hypothetical protein L596_001067 [Steinernema carpocapsae]
MFFKAYVSALDLFEHSTRFSTLDLNCCFEDAKLRETREHELRCSNAVKVGFGVDFVGKIEDTSISHESALFGDGALARVNCNATDVATGGIFCSPRESSCAWLADYVEEGSESQPQLQTASPLREHPRRRSRSREESWTNPRSHERNGPELIRTITGG